MKNNTYIDMYETRKKVFLMKTDALYFVSKIAGIFYVADWNGNIEIGYKSKKNADNYAKGATAFVYGEALHYNERRDRVLAYLETRKDRVSKPNPQYELSF